MTRRLVAAGALVILFSVTPLAAEPITARQFATRIDVLASEVRAADASSAVRLAGSMSASQRVTAGGAAYDVSLDWLRSALAAAPTAGDAWPDQRRRLAARLEAVSAEARMIGDAAPGDDSARRVLASVLADRRFERARHTSWLAALQERISEWLGDLLIRAAARGWGRRQIMTALAWTLSIAAVIVLLVWLSRAAIRRRGDRPIGVGPVSAIAQPGHVLGLQAAELIRAGRLRDGAQAAYRAALRRLEEEGVLRPDAASTPRETLRRIAPAHRRAAPLAAMTGVFERIWYASRPAAQDDGPRLLALLREFECLPSDRAT
jgi:hypothetical protein